MGRWTDCEGPRKELSATPCAATRAEGAKKPEGMARSRPPLRRVTGVGLRRLHVSAGKVPGQDLKAEPLFRQGGQGHLGWRGGRAKPAASQYTEASAIEAKAWEIESPDSS